MKVLVDVVTGTIVYPEDCFIIEANDIPNDEWNEMSDNEIAEYAKANGIKVL